MGYETKIFIVEEPDMEKTSNPSLNDDDDDDYLPDFKFDQSSFRRSVVVVLIMIFCFFQNVRIFVGHFGFSYSGQNGQLYSGAFPK